MAAKRKDGLTLLDAMGDPALFGPYFRDESWQAWRAFLSALFGLPMDKATMEIYQRHTGRRLSNTGGAARNAPPSSLTGG